MGFFFPWENRRSQRRKLQIRNIAFIPCPAVSSSYFAFPPTISVLTHPSKANSSTCVGNPVPLTYSWTLLSNSFFPLLHQIITLCWILSISTKTCYYFLHLLKKNSLLMTVLPLAGCHIFCSTLEQIPQKNHLYLVCPIPLLQSSLTPTP